MAALCSAGCCQTDFDLGVASVALVLLAPLLFLVAPLIKLDSAGPFFFRQERISQAFLIYEFR
jgi:lipopolysaccharide/colanic/teichoic acid biosynthesis glycosyltransferase